MGPELVTNGGFDTDMSGWTRVPPTSSSWTAGRGRFNTSEASLVQDLTLVLGSTYRMTFDFQSNDSDLYDVVFGTPTNQQVMTGTSADVISVSYDFTIVAGDFSGPTVTVGVGNHFTSGLYIDNVSFKEVILTLPDNDPSLITAVARVEPSMAFSKFVFAGQDTSGARALFKKSSNYAFNACNLWRSKTYEIGKDFDVLGITFNLVADLTSNTQIIPVLYFDDGSTIVVGNIIDSSNYSNDNKLIYLSAKNFGNSVHGKDNFFFELRFIGSVLATVSLPMFIDIDVLDT